MKEKEVIKNFEIYKKGISRLKELEKQLDNLDTRNFKKEEAAIRKKLKNVSKIPEIEDGIRKLRQRIAGIDVEYQQANLDKRQSREINKIEKELKKGMQHLSKKDLTDRSQSRQIFYLKKEENEIESKIPGIKRKISELEKEAEKALKKSGRKQLLRKEVKDVDYIPSLKRKISILKEEAERALNVACRKHLTKNEIQSIGKIPTLEGKIKYLRNKFSKEDKEIKRLKEIEKDYQPVLAALIDKTDELEVLNKKLGTTRKKINSVEAELPVIEKNLAEVRLEELPSIKRGIRTLRKDFRRESARTIPPIKKGISEIEQDIRQLKLRIFGIDTRYQKEIVDKKQDSKLSALRHKERVLEQDLEKEMQHLSKKDLTDRSQGIKIRLLRDNEEELEKQLEREEKQLKTYPQVKKKVSFLRRLFQKENKEIKELEEKSARLEQKLNAKTRFPAKKRFLNNIHELNEKVDSTREELNKKLTEELSESKWMIAREKQEIQEQVKNTIKEMAFQLAKEKQELNKQFIDELKKLEDKAENDKKEIYDLFLKRVIGLRQKINSLEENREEKRGKKEEEKEEKKTEEKYEKIEDEIGKIRGELEEFIDASKKEKISAKKKALESLKLELTQKEEHEEEQETEEGQEEENEEIEYEPKIVELPKITSPRAVEITENKPKKIKRMKIGKTAIYLEEEKFDEIYGNVKDLKRTLIRNKEDLKAGIEMQKGFYEKEVSRINEAISRISENVSKMKSNFPFEDIF